MTKDNAHDLKSPKALPIGEIIKNRKFRVPMYQRNYKWGTCTAEKLAKDLIESSRKSITKSIGLLTLHQGMDSEFLDIIDGQQRFITLSIIFNILCDEEMPIELSFERDGEDRARINAIRKKYTDGWCESSSDVDRIMRNKEQIKKCLGNISEDEKEKFKEYLLKSCVMLCSIVEADPEKEFMNLNAYKTKFSVCDYVRSNLISLNSFYREDLDKENSIIASCIEKHSYKTAIAHLYDDILDIFYSGTIAHGTYSDVYSVVQGKYFNPDITKESRINILFSKELSDTEKGYFSDEINKNVEDWIQMLLKVACAKKLMAQLKQEMEGHNFSSAKEIDDYQKLKQKNFLDLIMDLNMQKERIDTITLAKILKKNSNVGYVLMKELGPIDLKLANRYFESYVYSNINRPTITAAEVENDSIKLPKMNDEEIISCIQGAGQYVIDRFLHEQQQALDASVVIAPVLDLEDRENLEFGEELDTEEGDTIAVKELFNHKIKVPVIQRDYCMGARINEKEEADDFLGYLIINFQEGKEVVASTILISVAKAEKDIYIFDGQQRVYTIYQLLKYCDGKRDDGDDRFTFVGRKNGASKYSETAVENLRKAFDNRIKNVDIQTFHEFLQNKVKFKLKVTETVSDAEQFFMDINGGVSLKNYEIFKSCLCERLVTMKQTDFIKEMENKWLVWFYRFCDIKKEDETDIEELMEMRFIEFLCRFFIMEDSCGNDEKLSAFDGIDTKNELVGKLKYLENLKVEDISKIRDVMNYLVDHVDKIKNPSDKLNIIFKTQYCDLGSTVSRQCIGYYLLVQCEVQREKFIDKHKDYILHRFIDSLSDETRKLLKTIYSWKNEGDLIEIYDADLLIRDCILHIVGRKAGDGKYPYVEKKDILMNFQGGYNVGIRKLEGIPEEEVPAYYYDKMRKNPVPQDCNYIRAKYIYDKVVDENLVERNLTKLNFIWTKKSGKSIKKGDGVETYIVFSNKVESRGQNEYKIITGQNQEEWLTYRTDAYFLNSNVVHNLI